MNNTNNTKKILIGVVVLVLIIGFVAYFSATLSDSPEKVAKELNIGLISILSGDYAASGENIKNGVVLASEQYNKIHPESPIHLFIEDDGFSSRKGVSAYQKLTSLNHIDGLINVSTPTIDSIYESVVKDGMPVIQGGEQGSKPLADNVFGIFPDNVDSEYDYGVYLREKGVKEMVVVYTRNDAMIRFVEAFKAGFQG
ncbi:MAG: ABC transporter substrate-binding protein, partial [Patescibacteria group bacterium]